MPDVKCARCGQTRAGFDRAPFPGQIGARVVQEICQQCWSDWLKQQTMLINHYGLNVMDPQARAFLTNNLTAFRFRSGTSEDVDTTKKGTIQW